MVLSMALLCPAALAANTPHHPLATGHGSKLVPRRQAASRAASSRSSSARASASGTRAGKKTKSRTRGVRGQQAIAPERVSEIQGALARQHYLGKEADGQWDAETEAAMQKYQADHGWQTKLMPDSRALKALGLGPDYSNAINAKNSSFGPPPSVSTIPPSVAAGFTEGSGVVR